MGDLNQQASTDLVDQRKGEYLLIRDAEDGQLGSLLLGFVCPFMWYYAAILYFRKYYHKDPRERSGLAASAIAALICTIVVVIIVGIVLL
ncbi:uncharacterized protein LOC123210330 isoform X2 [Mangifera indica]|uniref:uncharacterized protein LOC123210330 isoform X2 n=1 Tax=Mangifera indica TaxID=29780 RepID=UPI001CF9B76B|nr:uncharacterized protein LOC123210330 isoform X2 [Mangifera indica]